MDGGSNGGLAGNDSFFLEETFDTANVQGVTDDTLSDLPIGTAVGLVHTADGEPALLYMHQYAFYDKGGTVHSKTQWCALGADVDDRSRRATVPGEQRIITSCGATLPLSIRNGLPMLDMRVPTPEEANDPSIREIIITSDTP